MRNKQQGFTLIEVLLSLMIFAMLGMAIYSVLSNTIQGHETLQSQNSFMIWTWCPYELRCKGSVTLVALCHYSWLKSVLLGP